MSWDIIFCLHQKGSSSGTKKVEIMINFWEICRRSFLLHISWETRLISATYNNVFLDMSFLDYRSNMTKNSIRERVPYKKCGALLFFPNSNVVKCKGWHYGEKGLLWRPQYFHLFWDQSWLVNPKKIVHDWLCCVCSTNQNAWIE